MYLVKKNKYLINLSAILLLFVFAFPTLSRDRQFQTDIQISLEKEVYLVGERTILTITVTNHDDFGPPVSPHIESQCIIFNSAGHQFFQNACISYGDELNMKNGEIRTFSIDIQDMYGKPHPEMFELTGVFKPGKYTIQSVWNEPGYVPIKSNILAIKVIPPAGEEKKALESYWQYRKYMSVKDYDSADQELSKYFTIFSKSVYAPKALGKKMFLHAYLKPDRKKLLECSKFVLKNLQNRGQARFTAAHHLLKVYELNGNKQGGIQYLENLARKTNSNKLKNCIKHEIEKVRTAVE